MKAGAFFAAIAGLPFVMAVTGCSKESLTPTRPWDRIIRYEFVEAWGDSGSGNGQFFYPQGVAVDASGNVYVVDTANRRIQKFASDGTYLTQWGTSGTGDGQFGSMQDIAIDSGGNVYVADAGNNRIQKFTGDGTYLTQWATPIGPINRLGVAVDAGGNVYVADAGSSQILKFTSDGTYLTQWGTYGLGKGQLFQSNSVAVDSRGNVYVADGQFSIHQYSSTGVYLSQWPMRDANAGAAERVAVDAGGNVYVSDIYGGGIKTFTGAGRLLAQWGPEAKRWRPDIAVDGGGNAYVTDTENNRVLKYALTFGIR